MPSYNEQVEVFGQAGESLGKAVFAGSSSRSTRGGLWSWSGHLSQANFDLGTLHGSGELVIKFDDGATGRMLVQNVQYRSRIGYDVRLVGNGMPPRVAA